MQECILARINEHCKAWYGQCGIQKCIQVSKHQMKDYLYLWRIHSSKKLNHGLLHLKFVGLPRELKGNLQILSSVRQRSLHCTVVHKSTFPRFPFLKDFFQNTNQTLVFWVFRSTTRFSLLLLCIWMQERSSDFLNVLK